MLDFIGSISHNRSKRLEGLFWGKTVAAASEMYRMVHRTGIGEKKNLRRNTAGLLENYHSITHIKTYAVKPNLGKKKKRALEDGIEHTVATSVS